MLQGEGWPTVARILQWPCSNCQKFHEYRRIRNWGRGTKIFGTWSTAYTYGMKRCLILLQRTGLNINISITDLVFFNITYVKKLNKVNRSVSSEGLCVGFFFCVCGFVYVCFCVLFSLRESAVWPRGRDWSSSWDFLGSFYCTLKFKQPFAVGSFYMPHPQAQAVSDPENRFIKVWREISYLCREAACHGLLFLFTKK